MENMILRIVRKQRVQHGIDIAQPARSRSLIQKRDNAGECRRARGGPAYRG